jgi:hypothetical protein
MASDSPTLDDIVRQIATELGADDEAEAPFPSMREMFLELMVIVLANLYGKTPLPGPLYDRASLRAVTGHLDEPDVVKFATRAEDWIRLEGLVRIQEGQKSYTLNRPSLAVLSTPTALGQLGEVMERVAACYAKEAPSPQLRRQARLLGSYFMTRLGRS